MQTEAEKKVNAMLDQLEANLNEIYNQTQLLAKEVEEIGDWIDKHEQETSQKE